MFSNFSLDVLTEASVNYYDLKEDSMLQLLMCQYYN